MCYLTVKNVCVSQYRLITVNKQNYISVLKYENHQMSLAVLNKVSCSATVSLYEPKSGCPVSLPL